MTLGRAGHPPPFCRELLSLTTPARFFEGHDGHASFVRTPFLVGLSTGIFAAFGIATATSPPVLVRTGLLAVICAFRTGLYVHTLAEQLHPTSEFSEPWAYILPGQNHESTLSRLNQFQDARVSIQFTCWRGKFGCLPWGPLRKFHQPAAPTSVRYPLAVLPSLARQPRSVS